MSVVWHSGQVVANRYRLEARLGEGGMGSVWRAHDLNLGSEIALKLLDPEIAESSEARARFVREAKAAAQLRSPHVVQILEYGIHADRFPFIAMEILEGESLADRMERLPGPLPFESVCRIITHVARAVGKAHELQIIHRDLKPENIFLVTNDDEEIAKVLDFGIAKQSNTERDGNPSSNTRTGALLGTPNYMSPEQAHGNKTVDFRTDLWSLAVIVFECVCGRLPFESPALGELVIMICTGPIPVPSQIAHVPPAFDDWFRKAASREPSQRFQSAKELARALRVALLGSGETTEGSGRYVIRLGGSTPEVIATGKVGSETPTLAGESLLASPGRSASTLNQTTSRSALELGAPVRETGSRRAIAIGVAVAALIAGAVLAAVVLSGPAAPAPEPVSTAESPATTLQIGAPTVPSSEVEVAPYRAEPRKASPAPSASASASAVPVRPSTAESVPRRSSGGTTRQAPRKRRPKKDDLGI